MLIIIHHVHSRAGGDVEGNLVAIRLIFGTVEGTECKMINEGKSTYIFNREKQHRFLPEEKCQMRQH